MYCIVSLPCLLSRKGGESSADIIPALHAVKFGIHLHDYTFLLRYVVILWYVALNNYSGLSAVMMYLCLFSVISYKHGIALIYRVIADSHLSSLQIWQSIYYSTLYNNV